MEEQDPNKTIKQTVLNGAKTTLKTVKNLIVKLLKLLLTKSTIALVLFFLVCFLLGGFVWMIEGELFDTASSGSSIFNKSGTTYVDEQTEEEIPLIRINEEGTRWVIPSQTVDYIRRQISETSDILRLNLVDGLNSYDDLEAQENREKVNKYLREFLKAEQASYYPNLEVE